MSSAGPYELFTIPASNTAAIDERLRAVSIQPAWLPIRGHRLQLFDRIRILRPNGVGINLLVHPIYRHTGTPDNEAGWLRGFISVVHQLPKHPPQITPVTRLDEAELPRLWAGASAVKGFDLWDLYVRAASLHDLGLVRDPDAAAMESVRSAYLAGIINWKEGLANVPRWMNPNGINVSPYIVDHLPRNFSDTVAKLPRTITNENRPMFAEAFTALIAATLKADQH